MTRRDLGRLWRRALLTTLALLTLAIGCAVLGTRGEQSESETHFLARCDSECGEGLSCTCGVCTQPCDSRDVCRGLSALAECTPIHEDACGSHALAICDVACTGDEDCRSIGFEFGCVAGACRQVLSLHTEQPLQTPGAAGSPGVMGPPLGTAGAAGGESEGALLDSHFTTSDGEFCAPADEACELEDSGVEFVIDLGKGMLATTEDGNSLFTTARASLERYVEQVNSEQVGFTFFPNRTMSADNSEPQPPEVCLDSSLDVPMAPVDVAQRDRLMEALTDAKPNPEAGSPLIDAYRAAVEKWRAHPEVGIKIIAVVTAGGPTFEEGCPGTASEQADLSAWYNAIGEAHAEGIKTLVFGPKGESRATDAALSQAARDGDGFQCGCAVDAAGCTCSDDGPEPCHSGLADDESQVIGQLIQRYECPHRDACSREIAPPAELQTLGPESAAVRVFIDGEPYLVRASENEACEVGYYAAKAEDGKVRVQLCAETCDLIKCLPGPVEWGFRCAP